MMLAQRAPAAHELVVPDAAVGPGAVHVPDGDAGDPPVVLNPAELRQLWQAYHELLDLHHAEVVEDEDFEDAHRLLVEQVLPLRSILRERAHLVVDPRVELTY